MNSTWFQSVVGWCLGAAALGLMILAWWAIFGDRSRGRRRCPRCWFDLSHTEGLTCGECGYCGRSERDLFRTRSRRVLAAAAIIGCALVSTYGLERMLARGWASYVPTLIATRLLPVAGDGRSLVDEVIRRVGAGELDAETTLALLTRAIRGDGAAPPPTDAWQAKYGRMLGPIIVALGPDHVETVHLALLRLPMEARLETRRFWPIDVAPTVDVSVKHLWPTVRGSPIDPQARVNIQGVVEGPGGPIPCTPDTHALHRGAIQPRSYSYRLPPLPRGDYTARLSITSEQRFDDDAPWVRAGEQTIAIPIRVEQPITAFLDPVEGAVIDAAVADVFSGGLVKYARGSLPVRINVNRRPTFIPELDDVAIGVRLEVFRNGIKGRELVTWWRGGSTGDSESAWEVPFVDDAVLLPESGDDDRWTVRLTGLPELALRVERARHYWSGQAEFEVAIVQNPRGDREAPPRGWIAADDPALAAETQQ